MAEHAEMLEYARRSPQDAEFITLSADTDEAARQRFAVRLAPHVNDLNMEDPWLTDPGVGSIRGSAFAESVIGEALGELYNPAQRDVLRRVNDILHAAAEAAPD